MTLSAHRSIAFRLIAAVLAVQLVASVAVILLSIGLERHAHFVSFDIMLRGRADSLLVAVQDSEDALADVMLDPAQVRAPRDDVWEVREQSGRLLGRSPNWEGAPEAMWSDSGDSVVRYMLNHRRYRILRLHASRIVDVGEPGGSHRRPVILLYGISTERVWRAINQSVRLYAYGSLALLLVTGPLIAWLLQRGLKPLRQLASLASQVSVDSWSFTPPPTARSTPELAPLTRALESVLERLQCSFTQQRVFVSDAAHELKTAVAVVKSSLQLLNIRPRSLAEYKAGLERALVDCQRLEDLVAKMLTLARVEAAAEDVEPSSADLALILCETVSELEPVAASGQIAVPLPDAASQPCYVALASVDCSLLLTNLLLNALQHSPTGSSVELRLSRSASQALLEIQDHGEGVDPEALPHVFDRFYRGDPSRTRSTGGTGLGLAIVKAIVDRAGGSVSLSSEPSHGACVALRLPLVSCTPHSARAE
jgi:signal transduction histidine kinase